MSIYNRVEDAKSLWQNGRHEGAILSVLLAIAATARLRYPDRKAMKDGVAFTQFFESANPGRMHVEFRKEMHSIEHIFYKWIRCELASSLDGACGIRAFEAPMPRIPRCYIRATKITNL